MGQLGSLRFDRMGNSWPQIRGAPMEVRSRSTDHSSSSPVPLPGASMTGAARLYAGHRATPNNAAQALPQPRSAPFPARWGAATAGGPDSGPAAA